ncbi:MAG TPA: cytidylate kinase family protein [Desulfobacterales bacterium]|nr:cytidylate kinase family protein [Desulfobacterales bacterium]
MPLITITHTFGSEGLEVARRVAEALGCELFDDSRLKRLVQEKGISAEEFNRLDERTPGYWASFFRSRPQIFVNILESAIYEAAHKGEGVIVGHGSQVLLRNFDCAFHVRLFAPETRRVDRLVSEKGLSRDAALRLVRAQDREQANFFKFAFQMDLDDPALYDLVVNTHKLAPATAARIVIDAARSEELRACSLTALETMDRLALEKQVRAALMEARVDPSLVLVEARADGVVHVGGVSANDEDRQRVAAIVRAVSGVKKVVSEMEVVRGGV